MNHTKQQQLSTAEFASGLEALSAHKSLPPPVGCASKTDWFLEQGRWTCSSSRCPAAGRLSTQLSVPVVGTQHSQQLCAGPKKPTSLPHQQIFSGTNPTVSWYSHTGMSRRVQAQPCRGLSLFTVKEGQEGQPALHVWPKPGQNLSLFITQPHLLSALALDLSSLSPPPPAPLCTDQFCDTPKGKQ